MYITSSYYNICFLSLSSIWVFWVHKFNGLHDRWEDAVLAGSSDIVHSDRKPLKVTAKEAGCISGKLSGKKTCGSKRKKYRSKRENCSLQKDCEDKGYLRVLFQIYKALSVMGESVSRATTAVLRCIMLRCIDEVIRGKYCASAKFDFIYTLFLWGHFSVVKLFLFLVLCNGKIFLETDFLGLHQWNKSLFV